LDALELPGDRGGAGRHLIRPALRPPRADKNKRSHTLTEGTHSSNERKKGKGNSKSGNRYLAWAYIEAANFAVRFSPELRAWYQRKAARTKRVVALKALANKLAKACFFILRDRVDFDVRRLVG
jgi:transposase